MFSTAIARKPSATSSGVRATPVAAATSAASAAKCSAHDVARRAAGRRSARTRCGKKRGLQLAEHDVGVGDGERPAAAVAGRAGIRAGALRADAEARAVEGADRAAARRDGVDRHHRRAHAHAGDLGLEGALVLAGVVRDVGRGAAHVEADDLRRSPARALTAPTPTTPPAGPERIASLPWNRCASARPPVDCMNSSRTLARARRRRGRRSAAGSARDRRRPRWCRRGRRASSAARPRG